MIRTALATAVGLLGVAVAAELARRLEELDHAVTEATGLLDVGAAHAVELEDTVEALGVALGHVLEAHPLGTSCHHGCDEADPHDDGWHVLDGEGRTHDGDAVPVVAFVPCRDAVAHDPWDLTCPCGPDVHAATDTAPTTVVHPALDGRP